MKKKLLIMGGALACLAGVGGIMAYFTDTDAETNNFVIGKIDIDLDEPNWEEPENVLPNQTIVKDPNVKNVGNNPAFIFVEVDVPYANVVTAQANGTKNPAADTELFSYTVNSGWIEVGQPVKANGVVTHLYAYAANNAMTALDPDATTANVFDSVTFANVIEGQNLETTTQTINVRAYGIQTTNVNGGVTDPVAVWAVVNNQVKTN